MYYISTISLLCLTSLAIEATTLRVKRDDSLNAAPANNIDEVARVERRARKFFDDYSSSSEEHRYNRGKYHSDRYHDHKHHGYNHHKHNKYGHHDHHQDGHVTHFYVPGEDSEYEYNDDFAPKEIYDVVKYDLEYKYNGHNRHNNHHDHEFKNDYEKKPYHKPETKSAYGHHEHDYKNEYEKKPYNKLEYKPEYGHHEHDYKNEYEKKPYHQPEYGHHEHDYKNEYEKKPYHQPEYKPEYENHEYGYKNEYDKKPEYKSEYGHHDYGYKNDYEKKYDEYEKKDYEPEYKKSEYGYEKKEDYSPIYGLDVKTYEEYKKPEYTQEYIKQNYVYDNNQYGYNQYENQQQTYKLFDDYVLGNQQSNFKVVNQQEEDQGKQAKNEDVQTHEQFSAPKPVWDTPATYKLISAPGWNDKSAQVSLIQQTENVVEESPTKKTHLKEPAQHNVVVKTQGKPHHNAWTVR